MPDSTDLSDAQIEEANLRLNDGLVTCRSVVNDYRAKILGARPATADPDQPESEHERPEYLPE